MKKINTTGYNSHTFEWFVQRARAKHGDKYGYAAAEWFYDKTKSVVPIYCKKHGDFFWQNVGRHINAGQGCPQCGFQYAYTHSKGNKDEFLRKAKERFGDRFSFPGEYVNNKTPILVHCNICGNEFMKRPNDFLCSSDDGGCKVCRMNRWKEKALLSYPELVDICDKKFGKGNYLQIVPFEGKKDSRDKKDKITLHCDIHGNHETYIYSFLRSQGKCSRCAPSENPKKTFEEFKRMERDLWGESFSYSGDDWDGMDHPITFRCNKCGYVFKRKPTSHLSIKKSNPNSLGCEKCSLKAISEERTNSTEDFVRRCKEKYGDKYDYSETVYTGIANKIKVKCNECGRLFEIEANSHLSGGHGCPYHYCNKSIQEESLKDFIQTIYNGPIHNNDRTILKGHLELDIFLPELKLAFEYDGIFWHGEGIKGKDGAKRYHLDKTEQCKEKGVRLIHVYENEWSDPIKKEVWKSIIKNLLGVSGRKIYARKCELREIGPHEAYMFMKENHLQGKCGTNFRYGLFYGGELVSAMTFGKARNSISGKKHEYELLRFCNKLDTIVVGAASRLFKKFVEDVNPDNIVSYADRRWSQGKLYEKLGFRLYNISSPSYAYLIKGKLVNRLQCRKSILVEKYGCPKNMTEHDFCYSQKWYRIYDCGCLCYDWLNPNRTK